MKLDVDLRYRSAGFSLETAFSYEGDSLGIFGPSGSGKSTLFDLLAGLRRPAAGRIVLDSHVLVDTAAGVFVPPEQRRIGLVFQQGHLFPHLSVRRNLEYGWSRVPGDARRFQVEAMAELLELGPLLDRSPANLSGGERQRVAIGRAILAEPRLILLDEPLNGLDDRLKFQVVKELRTIMGECGTPVLFISHAIREMQWMTATTVVIEDGHSQPPVPTDALARRHLAANPDAYMNLLDLRQPTARDDLWGFDWQGTPIVLTGHCRGAEGLYELSSREITLFPDGVVVTSARNRLSCRVAALFEAGLRLGVELDCGGGNRLVAQIVPSAAADLGVEVGQPLTAIVKASAFRRVG